MDANLYGNNSPSDVDDHQLSDIIEIITPELDGSTAEAKPHLRVVVQPTQKPIRFRYKCEGRTAGTIPGENSAKDTKTYPTIEIVNYNGEARILVSCVTKDEPYRQHPHLLVGRNCKNGVLQKDVGPGQSMRIELSNVGIQCVTRHNIVTSLQERLKKNIDPFKTGFDHMNDTNSIELNALRLCFQAFLKTSNGLKALRPIVTEPLYDRKAKNDLVISELCSCAATVDGGDRLILLCEKVNKDDIKVRFKALDNDREIWHAYADFEPSNVHKQTAIAFRTPRYPQHDLPKHAKTYVELECPSTGKRSEALEFEFHDPDYFKRERKRRKVTGKSLIQQMNDDLGLNLASGFDFYNLTVPAAAPAMVPPHVLDIKTEPELPTLAAPQKFDTYRNVQQLSPLPQMSPLSPINYNTTPSPKPLSVNVAAVHHTNHNNNNNNNHNGYIDPLCDSFENSTLQNLPAFNNNNLMYDFNNQENMGHLYQPHSNNNNNNTNFNHPTYNAHNYATTASTNPFGEVKRVASNTSGGSFIRINEYIDDGMQPGAIAGNVACTPTNTTVVGDIGASPTEYDVLPFYTNQHNTSEIEKIERIKMNLMDTSPTSQAPANGWNGTNMF